MIPVNNKILGFEDTVTLNAAATLSLGVTCSIEREQNSLELANERVFSEKAAAIFSIYTVRIPWALENSIKAESNKNPASEKLTITSYFK